MKSRFLPGVWLVATGLLCAAAAQSPSNEATEEVQYVFLDETPVVDLVGWRVMRGDSLEWAGPSYDDSQWELDDGRGLWVASGAPGKGVRWYRKAIFIPEALDPLTTLALYEVAAVSASEIYWDGVLIAANGEIGHSRDEEVPGKSGQLFPVYNSLGGPGRHVIALRMSNQHSFSGLISPPLRLGLFTELQEGLFRSGTMALFLAGIFVVTALFHFAMMLGRANRWSYSIFCGFCLSCAAYIIIQSMLKYFHIDLGFYYGFAALNDIPWFLMMSLLPIFFLYEFSTPHRHWFAVALLAVTFIIVLPPRLVTFGVLPPAWLAPLDRINRVHSISTILLSIAISSWAIRERRRGSRTILIGLLIFLVGAYVSYRTRLEHGWAIGFAFLILVITIYLARQMAQRNRILQETQLRSARLELELLKRHIQPHFLLNSLNSIVAWLEEDPRTAGQLVNALAEELRMLLTISGKKMTTLDEEIALCRAHLKVMSLRQEKSFELVTEGVKGDEELPPLVVHTLVENGLTHGYKGRDRGQFRLSAQREGRKLRLELFNDGASEARPSQFGEGTGLKYVRTRLEEACRGKWSLDSGPAENGWRVAIELEAVDA